MFIVSRTSVDHQSSYFLNPTPSADPNSRDNLTTDPDLTTGNPQTMPPPPAHSSQHSPHTCLHSGRRLPPHTRVTPDPMRPGPVCLRATETRPFEWKRLAPRDILGFLAEDNRALGPPYFGVRLLAAEVALEKIVAAHCIVRRVLSVRLCRSLLSWTVR